MVHSACRLSRNFKLFCLVRWQLSDGTSSSLWKSNLVQLRGLNLIVCCKWNTSTERKTISSIFFFFFLICWIRRHRDHLTCRGRSEWHGAGHQGPSRDKWFADVSILSTDWTVCAGYVCSSVATGLRRLPLALSGLTSSLLHKSLAWLASCCDVPHEPHPVTTLLPLACWHVGRWLLFQTFGH